MIIEAILNLVKSLIMGILSLLPTLNATGIPNDLLNGFASVIYGVSYFFPVADVLIMLAISFAITNFHIIWRLIQRVYDAIPFV